MPFLPPHLKNIINLDIPFFFFRYKCIILFLKSGLLFLSSLTVDKRLGGGGHTIIPSTREAETGESLEV